MHKKTITCLNGQFMDADAAMLPVADRGTRFGDGVFETIALTRGVPYQWALHMARLEAGLAALRITPPVVDWQQIAREVIAQNNASNGFLRISISRGVGSHGYLPNAEIIANWVVEYLPAAALPTAPFTLWQTATQRAPLAALPGNHKLAHGIGSTLALLEARDHGCDEALLLSSTQHICEAASANIFWLTGDQLYTPALTTGCLAGTTRAAVLRLSPVICHEITADSNAIATADAVFITNVRLGVWPVRAIQPLGKHYDTAHPILREISARLAADIACYHETHHAQWARA